jgi:hypothetical protein
MFKKISIHFNFTLLAMLAAISLNGWLVSKAQEQNSQPVKVTLPPFFVEEKGPHWNYASTEGLEVLTRCDEDISQGIVRQVYKAQSYLDALLPKKYQVSKTLPRVLLIYPHEMKPSIPQGILSKNNDDNDSVANIDFRHDTRAFDRRTIEFFPNLDLRDPDSRITFFIAPSNQAEIADAVVTPQAVQQAMLERLPALPWWFTLGFSHMYRSLFNHYDQLGFKVMIFNNEEDTGSILKNPEYPRLLPPIKELFSEYGITSEVPDFDIRKIALLNEAELFLRWVYSDSTGKRREQLFQFVDKTISEPASESIFLSCFGLNYTELWERLNDYLPQAINNPIYVPYKEDFIIPKLKLRLATETEIGRIKGDWLRFEVDYVKKSYPEYAPRYLQEARLSLQHAHDRGGDSPTLFSIRGLLELSVDNIADARGYLEDACAAHVIRPHAYYELAKLRYNEAIKNPEGEKNKLSDNQIKYILSPLLLSANQSPRPIDAHVFASRLIIQSNARLYPELLDYLRQGVILFPRNPQLLYLTAAIYSTHGNLSDSDFLLNRALRLEPQEGLKKRITILLDAIHEISNQKH